MGLLKTFCLGGIHPKENKLSADKKTEIFPIPKKVVIMLSQHIGAPSIPLVKKGDVVKVGTLIAKGEAFVSANIHSSVSGKVNKIEEILDSSGYRKNAIFIDVEGDDWEESIDKTPDIKKEITLTTDEIITKIQQSGIVGLGGATFPTHVKLKVPQGKTADTLVINGVECEPYLTADHRLMLEKSEEMLIGIKILMKSLNVSKAVIGIENNKKNAIDLLTNLVKNYEGISIQPLKVQYPQGGEKQLIKAALNREVPSGKLPIDVGCVVQNVGTAFAVYEAVQKNKPLFERIVTVTGKSLKNPCNLLVRIGTSTNELIEFAGGLPEDSGKIISGGPMMGKSLNSIDIPVVKGMSGLLILPQNESKRTEPKSCIRCAKCTFACPMGLAPYLLENLVTREVFDKAEKESIMDCIECGSCSYVCPASRPLLDYIRLGKNKVIQLRKARG